MAKQTDLRCADRFVWIFLMNMMDLLPIDYLPHWHSWIAGIIPKTCAWFLPLTLISLCPWSFGVFFLILFYSIKMKGCPVYERTDIDAIQPLGFLCLLTCCWKPFPDFKPVSGFATIRQHVCGRDDFHPDRRNVAVVVSVVTECAVGYLPHSD